MSSILYIDKGYCRTLEQLQQYFKKVTSTEDSLYQELLTLQRDGLIAKWLEEGSEREKKLAKKIRSLPATLTNRELMEKLGELMTNMSTLYDVSLLSYVELKEVAYTWVVPSAKGVEYAKIVRNETISVEEKKLAEPLGLRLTFKVVKPEKEIFRLKTTLSLKGVNVDVTETEFRLDNEPMGKDIVVNLCVPISIMDMDAEGSYSLEIRDESQALFSLYLSPKKTGCFNVDGAEFMMIPVSGHADGDFYIGETQVTRKLWKSIAQYVQSLDADPSYFKGDDNRPVEQVSWNDCDKFIEELNKRLEKKLPEGYHFALPTESQWEYAASGGDKTRGFQFSGCNNERKLKQYAWYRENAYYCGSFSQKEHHPDYGTHPVKSRKPNELNLYDMSGNVWEWCADWYDFSSSNRVTRGGGWRDFPLSCRVAIRSQCSPDYRALDVGFRLALCPSCGNTVKGEEELDLKNGIAEFVASKVKGRNNNMSDSNNDGMLPFCVNGVIFNMVKVESGAFYMGNDENRDSPIHHVELSHDYYIGETQVTQDLWTAVGCKTKYVDGCNPVVGVTWDDCSGFIKRLNQKLCTQIERLGMKFRLPTEAEWEFAARGGRYSKGCEYSGSNKLGEVAWYDENSRDRAHPVKQKRANELGLYDMSGNVWEWCQDWYDEFDEEDQYNPSGPSSGEYRVLRGGSWRASAECCCVAGRSNSKPDRHNNSIGFRLALG